MTDDRSPSTPAEDGLHVRGQLTLTTKELADLREALGDDLETSSTMRAWMAGDQQLQPHSIAVAVEAQLRMLFGEPPAACELLADVLDRLAEAFPEEVQPLDTA